MFADTLRAAVESASPHQLDQLARDLWRAYGAGAISDDDAAAIGEAVERRRRGGLSRCPGAAPAHQRVAVRAPRRPQRSPDRQRSIERRRLLAASGPMPPALAAKFSTGELAALKIVASEVQARGSCTACIAEIAARAGVCARTVQRALRTAEALALVRVEERRISAFRNDPNRVSIIDSAWRAWLRLGDKGSRTGPRALSSLSPTPPGRAGARAGAARQDAPRGPWRGRWWARDRGAG